MVMKAESPDACRFTTGFADAFANSATEHTATENNVRNMTDIGDYEYEGRGSPIPKGRACIFILHPAPLLIRGIQPAN